MIFSIFILLFSKVNAFSTIEVSPINVEQGNGKTTSITVNVNKKACYVKYTESTTNPSVSSTFFIKAGDDTTQSKKVTITSEGWRTVSCYVADKVLN